VQWCRSSVAASALIWALGVTARASAEGVDLVPEGPEQLAIGGEIGYFTDDQAASTIHVFAPRLAAHYAIDERWSIAGDFGMVLLSQHPDAGEGDHLGVRPGNPTAFLLRRGFLGSAHYHVGIGGAAPLAVIERDGSGRIHRSAYNHAQALSGLWDTWVWAPSRGAVILYGRLEYDLDPEARLELELAPALMIPAREAYLRDSVQAFIPTAIDLSTDKGPLRLGLRLQAVFMPADDPDALQLSLVPRVRLAIGRSFIEARYNANLDEPLAGERGPRIWGVHLAAGGPL
jgi:hypothetical protein